MQTLHKLFTAAGIGVAAASIVGHVRSAPTPSTVPIACTVSKNNDGCETTVSCPAGTKVRGAKVACNLEWGSVTDRQLASIPDDVISVLKPSDHVEEGSCWVGTTTIGEGQANISGVTDHSQVKFGCQEHDKNGGDCEIRGVLRCE